jgi:spore coat polysaccharide biosynthesis predicted glycosyltransferase SpsG
MAARAKKLNIYLRFDIGKFNGLGHAIRSLELAKTLKKKINVILCTSHESKNKLKIKGFDLFLKRKNENEESYILRIAKNKNDKILFIDNLYNYKSSTIRAASLKFKKIFFYQNFSNGIQEENIVINPTPNLNTSINIKKKIKSTHIFSGDEYLIIPKSKKYRKKNYLGISFGGSDPKLISLKVLKYLKKMNWKNKTYLFIGLMFEFKKDLKKIKVPKNIEICDFKKENFLKSSLAICSPGITAFELLNNDIFSLYISHSKKHYNLGKYIDKKYAFSKNLNIFNKLNFDEFKKHLNYHWINKANPNSLNKKKINLINNSCKKLLKLILNETK